MGGPARPASPELGGSISLDGRGGTFTLREGRHTLGHIEICEIMLANYPTTF
jgi:hypothetical protein